MRFDSMPHHFSEKGPTQHALAHIPDGSTEELSQNIGAVPRENTRFSFRSFGVVLASCLAYFSNQYSISVIAIHLYAIGEVFNDYKQVVWFVNGASLSVLVLGPIISYYATVKTRKWFILSGLLAGMAGQLIAGLAQGMHVLIIGQVLVGITLATQQLLVTIPTELLPQSNRKLAQMLSNIAGGLGGICGAVIGGGILQTNKLAGDTLAWQWIFRLAVIFYGSTFILLALMYQARPLNICVEASQAKKSFDWAGTFLVNAAVVLFVTGTSIGGEPMPWNALPVILTLIGGVTCLFLFGIWELWGTSTGLLHHEMFSHGRNILITLMLFFIDGILFVVFLVWYNQEIYLLFEMRPLIQGSRFVLFYGIVTILAPVVAFYCSRKKSIKFPLAIGYLFVMVASILMATITLNDGKISIFYIALAAIGLTAPLVLLRTVIQLCAPAHLMCFVTSLTGFIRTLGIITGNVLSNVTINSRYNALLSRNFANSVSELGISVEGSSNLLQALRMRNTDLVVDVASELGLSQEALKIIENIANKAQMDAFRIVWIVVAVLAFLAIGGCIAISTVNESEPPTRSTPTITLSSDSMPRIGSAPHSPHQERFSTVLDIRRDPEKPLFDKIEEIVKY